MELKDIQSSLSEMSDDELRERLLAIRSNRRISKRTAAPGRKSTAKKSEASAEALLGKMSLEDMEKLLKQFGK